MSFFTSVIKGVLIVIFIILLGFLVVWIIDDNKKYEAESYFKNGTVVDKEYDWIDGDSCIIVSDDNTRHAGTIGCSKLIFVGDHVKMKLSKSGFVRGLERLP